MMRQMGQLGWPGMGGCNNTWQHSTPYPPWPCSCQSGERVCSPGRIRELHRWYSPGWHVSLLLGGLLGGWVICHLRASGGGGTEMRWQAMTRPRPCSNPAAAHAPHEKQDKTSRVRTADTCQAHTRHHRPTLRNINRGGLRYTSQCTHQQLHATGKAPPQGRSVLRRQPVHGRTPSTALRRHAPRP